MKNPLKKPMTPTQKAAMADVKARGKDTKVAQANAKEAKKKGLPGRLPRKEKGK